MDENSSADVHVWKLVAACSLVRGISAYAEILGSLDDGHHVRKAVETHIAQYGGPFVDGCRWWHLVDCAAVSANLLGVLPRDTFLGTFCVTSL